MSRNYLSGLVRRAPICNRIGVGAANTSGGLQVASSDDTATAGRRDLVSDDPGRETSAEMVPAEPTGADRLPVESCALDLVGILSAVQETAYLWDIATDRMEWESNAAEVLGLGDLGMHRHRH